MGGASGDRRVRHSTTDRVDFDVPRRTVYFLITNAHSNILYLLLRYTTHFITHFVITHLYLPYTYISYISYTYVISPYNSFEPPANHLNTRYKLPITPYSLPTHRLHIAYTLPTPRLLLAYTSPIPHLLLAKEEQYQTSLYKLPCQGSIIVV